MADGYEPGFRGRMVSLGGVAGREGLGLHTRRPDAPITVTDQYILNTNQARMWALIQNTGLVNDLRICLDEGTGIAPAFVLKPGETLQIDKNLPWTGAVYAQSTTTTVEYIEASVQE